MKTLTTSQAAEILGVSDRHVRRLINENILPAERKGKVWHIDERSILLYQEGTTKKIKEVLDELSSNSDMFIASPETIESLRKKNLPFNSSLLTYEDYLESLFKEKRKDAFSLIKTLPLLDENIANPIASALYNEFRECYVLRVNGAAITLAIILLEYSMKQRVFDTLKKSQPTLNWSKIEKKSYQHFV